MIKKSSLLSLSVAFISASPSYAEVKPPSLKISGYTVVSASSVSQKNKTSGKGGGIPAIGIGASDLYFTAQGQSEGGFTYKYRMNINAVPFANDTAIDRNFIEFGSDCMGTLQVGGVSGVDDTMTKGGFSLIGGAAGIDGTFGGAYNMSSGVNSGVHLQGYTKRANKISYATPTFSGFQGGISFTPNTSNLGRKRNYDSPNVVNANDSGIYANKDYAAFGLANTAASLTYSNTWQDWSLQLSAIGITERSRLKAQKQHVKVRNLKTWQVSSTVGYKDFRVATSYFDNGKSRLPYDANQVLDTTKNLTTTDLNEGNAGKAWDVAGQYTMGAYQFAVGYFETLRKINAQSKARSQILTLTADFNALPGLKFFAEADFAKSGNTQAAIAQSNAMKADSGCGRNSGNIFVVGTKVSF